MTKSWWGHPIAGIVRLREPSTRWRRVVPTVIALVALIASLQIATAFMQVPDDPSPASGTAQVVAQGVVDVGSGDLRWRVTERTAQPPANASSVTSDLGFITVGSGVVLVDDHASGRQQRIAAGEAMITEAGADQTRVALGSDPASYRELSLVDAAAAGPSDATVVFESEPFAGLGARHDLDLVQDSLGPGASLAIPAGSMQSLVLILDGTADVTTESGDVISLGAGEATALDGALGLVAGENGARIAVTYTGPAAPRLAEAEGTPRAGRSVEQEATAVAPAAASPSADAPELATDETDEDGDGLTAAQEAEPGTDPALADTDEDGLTDGQEVLEIASNPLSADTDGDGVLDGDEVAQGTDPLDGATGVATGEEAPPVEEAPPAAEEPAPEEPQATAGDSDGDGLEDAIEFELGTDTADGDTDDDGLTDGEEYYVHQTGTRNPDTDGDGVDDGTEIANGTGPNDPSSF